MRILTNTYEIERFSDRLSDFLDSQVETVYLVAEPFIKNTVTIGREVEVFPWNGEDVDAVLIVANKPNSLWAFAATGAGMVYQTYVLTDQGVCPVLFGNVPEGIRIAIGVLRRILQNLEEGLSVDPDRYLTVEMETLDRVYARFREVLNACINEKLQGLKSFFDKEGGD